MVSTLPQHINKKLLRKWDVKMNKKQKEALIVVLESIHGLFTDINHGDRVDAEDIDELEHEIYELHKVL